VVFEPFLFVNVRELMRACMGMWLGHTGVRIGLIGAVAISFNCCRR
jgi:hypothetical protein